MPDDSRVGSDERAECIAYAIEVHRGILDVARLDARKPERRRYDCQRVIIDCNSPVTKVSPRVVIAASFKVRMLRVSRAMRSRGRRAEGHW